MIVDELDFTNENQFYYEKKIEIVKSNFERRNLKVHAIMSNNDTDVLGGVREELRKFIDTHPEIKTVSFSDGVTLYQLDLFNWMREEFKNLDINIPLERGKTGHYKVFGNQPFGRMDIPHDEWKKMQNEWYENLRATMLSDLLIISANAITLDGKIVSIDGIGNRVAGMIFGPRYVICIAGRNKICKDVDEAQNRIRNYVTPMTYIRHMMKHDASFQDVPCVKLGKCVDCYHEYSACRNYVVIRGNSKTHSDRIHLFLVNKELGF